MTPGLEIPQRAMLGVHKPPFIEILMSQISSPGAEKADAELNEVTRDG